jgi:thiol-disulfide isomerase/thioredoxin
MLKKLLALFALLFALCTPSSFSADSSGPASDLQNLVGRVRSRLKEGKNTEKALAPEIQEFDALLTKYKADKSDAVAEILFMKAMLYVQVFHDSTKGDAMLSQLKTDFPNSKAADRLAQEEKANAIQAKLKEGAIFPGFSETDLHGQPVSVAKYKGKVVLVDFWATWCGPCVGELPHVLATYKKHHDAGFEIIGISLDEDRDKLTSFMEKNNVVWQQFFDGKGWQNKLAANYGIRSIPATFLLDGTGKIIGRDLRGDDLEEAVAKALK